MSNLQEVFEAMFKEEFLKVISMMDNLTSFKGVGDNGQFSAYSGTDCFSCGFFVNRSTIDAPIAGVDENKIYTIFEQTFLQTFNFIEEEDITFKSTTKTHWKPTANLQVKFADASRGWAGDIDIRFKFNWFYGLQSFSEGGFNGIKIRYDVNATFLNLKNLSHTKSSEPRTLFIYSSLCEPQTLGEDTKDLLSHVSYQPSLKGGGIYEPRTIQYRGLRTQEFNTVETKLREEDEDTLAKFASGATIVTLHLRRKR